MSFIKTSILTILAVSTMFGATYQKVSDSKIEKVKYNVPEFLKGMGLAEAYYRQLPNDKNKDDLVDLATQAKEDQDFLDGNKYIYNKKYQLLQKDIYDAEFPQKPKTILMPDYPKALYAFSKSVEKTGSPISAYEGLMIIRNYLGPNFRNTKDLRMKFTDVLYNNGDCEGYLEKGREYLYGAEGVSKDPKKAKEIFKEGLTVCNNVNYFGTILSSKMLTADIYIKKENKKKKK